MISAKRVVIATVVGLVLGLLLGAIALLPLSLAGVWAGLKWWPGFVFLLGGGLIGGFLIELVTSVIFGAAGGRFSVGETVG